MAESAEEVYAGSSHSSGSTVGCRCRRSRTWDIFPWDGEMVPKVLEPPLAAEEPGGARATSRACRSSDLPDHAIWRNERWVVTSTQRAPGCR